MKMELNIGKKHLYIASVIIALLALVVFAAGASRDPGHSYDQIYLALDPITIDQTSNKVTVAGDLTVTGDIEGRILGAVDTLELLGVGNDEDGPAAKYNGCTKVVSEGNPDKWNMCPTGFFLSAIGTKAGGGVLGGDNLGSITNHLYYVIYLCCPLPGYQGTSGVHEGYTS